MASSVKPKPVKKKWLHLGSGLGPVWHSLCQNGFTNEVKAGKAKKRKKERRRRSFASEVKAGKAKKNYLRLASSSWQTSFAWLLVHVKLASLGF